MPDPRALKVITITKTATSTASVVLSTIPDLGMEILYLFIELVNWRRLRYSNTTGTQDPEFALKCVNSNSESRQASQALPEGWNLLAFRERH